jgi:hypothetical protein
MLKFFESLIQSRLYSWMESRRLIPPEQLAYRAQYSGTDHIYTLNVIREDALARRKKLFVAFIDLKKGVP